MKFDLLKLKNNIESEILIDEDVDLDSSLIKNTELLDIKNVHALGNLKKDTMGDIELNLNVSGIMILPCAITLEPVDYPFDYEISDKLADILKDFNKKVENTIDILPIIWENILMEIPMKVVSPNAHLKALKGDGWKFVTEQESNNVNPELQKLKDLL